MDKKHLVSLSIILGCLAIVGITTTFAYFVATINKSNINDTNMNAAKVGSIKYEGETTFSETNIYPGMKAVQTFTIESGTQEGKGIYEIDLEGVLPEVFGSDVEITLYKTTDPSTNNVLREEGSLTQTNEGFVKEDNLVINGSPEIVYGPTSLTNSSEIILEQADFDTETLQKTTYYLVYNYKNNGNQNNQQGETFSGKVTVKLIAYKLATQYILSMGETAELKFDNTIDNNLRYVGANPNNYVDIGDRYGESAVINKWDLIGMPAASVEECNDLADATFSCDNFSDMGFSSKEECQNKLILDLENSYNVSSIEEFKSTYCIQEDVSNQPILWRIIGVFNNIDDGTGKKETRLKIIRDEPIGTYSWDYDSNDNFDNDWSDSALQQVLNTGAYWNRTSGECPAGQNGAPKACDFSSTGLTDEAKEMIGNTLWHLGGAASYSSSSNGLASHWYTYERGTTVYSGRPTEWIGKIGLMYPSDYGYATSGGETTNREKCLNKELYNWNDSSYSDCKNNDWLYNSSNSQWTLTSYSSSSVSVFGVDGSGRVVDGAYDNHNALSPALYLSSNVKISGGEGTSDNPYTLSL